MKPFADKEEPIVKVPLVVIVTIVVVEPRLVTIPIAVEELGIAVTIALCSKSA